MVVGMRIGARAALLAGTMLVGLASGLPSLAAESTRYTYDALGRVVSAVDTNGKTVVYAYDNAGNRTRVSNGVEFAEIIPTAFSASSNAGTSGLATPGAMRDGQFGPLASIHITNVEAGAWILVDLGASKSVNHIEVAPALALPLEAGPEDLNDTLLQYSVDGTTWRDAGAISGVAVGATRTISLGGVTLRHLRLKRPNASALAIGDLRLFSSAPPAGSPLVAEADTITSTGSAVTFDPRDNDYDADGHPITVTSVEDPPHGQATINAGASITYTPDLGYTGPDSFLYAIADGHDATASARVAVTVRSASNNPPVAVPDSFSALDRPTAAIEQPTFLWPLSNDYDADGDVLTVTDVSTPAHGQAAIAGGGLIIYQADVGYLGTDTLTYTVVDGRGGTATAAITLDIANAPPIATPDSADVQRDTSTVLRPLANDSDPNGDPLTITAITTPTRGTAVLNPDKTVTYTTNPAVTGADSFSYTLSDGRGGTATGSVAINIAPTTAVELLVMEPAKYSSEVTITGRRFVSLADRSGSGTSRSMGNVYLTSPISTGKAYWEVRHLCGAIMPGVTDNPSTARSWGGAMVGYNAGNYSQYYNWTPSGSVSVSFGAQAANDAYGFALDADAKTLKIYKNNVLGSTLNLPFSGPYFPHSGSVTVADSQIISGQACAAGDASGEFIFGSGTVHSPPAGYERLAEHQKNELRAVDDLLIAIANNAKTLDPRFNDVSPAGEPLTITRVNQANYGTVVLNSGASITYTAAAGYVGPDSFSYTITDGKGATSSAAVRVMVGSGPQSFSIDPPVNGLSTWNLQANGPLNLGTAGVWTIVPQNTFFAPIKAWGAGGGSYSAAQPGGGGGFAEGLARLDSGLSYKLYVGGGGSHSPMGANGGLNGGGNSGNAASNWRGTGGGGYSGVRLTTGSAVMIAGGGGGSGFGGAGGGGGGTTPEDGLMFSDGAGGQALGGSVYQGADGVAAPSSGNFGGGGGGGYIGGGGGRYATANTGGGGGAGGSGFIDATRLAGATMQSAAGPKPANRSDPDRGQAGPPAQDYGLAAPSGRLIIGGPSAPAAAGGDPPYTPPGNLAPKIASDALYTVTGTAKTFDPRANDWDPNGDALTITAANGAAHGTLLVNAGASITYTPATGYAGTDSFSYTVSDGALTATAAVSVKVGAGYAFTISPAVMGKTSWDLETDGPLNLGNAGVWTITPQTSFTIPVKAWGGGGGVGCCGAAGAVGGGGGHATAKVSLSAGASYKLYVGGGGAYSPMGANGGLNGGGHSGDTYNTYRGAGGGGYSGIRTAAGAGVLIAGGGGGNAWGGGGGGGGGAVAENGATFAEAAGGLAGGGTAYQGANGVASYGNGNLGGGGGGGYVGGGGGKSSQTATRGGGGAGGSGYFDPASTTMASLIGATGSAPANGSDPDRGQAGTPQSSTSAAPISGRLILLRGQNP